MAIKQTNAVEDTNVAAQADAPAQVVEKVEQVTDQVVEGKAEVVEAKADSAPAQATDSQAQAETSRATESAAALDDVVEEPEPVKAEEPAASTAVSTQAGTTAVSTARVQGAFLQQILADLAAEGFEDTKLDYSSFLNITLNKQIETSEGHELPNTGFLVRLASARTKYCFRNNNPVENEVEVAYSYDRNAAEDKESPVYAAIQKWKEEGLDLDSVKEYKEVLAVMLDDAFGVDTENKGELNGKLITIQVAPTSQGRWAGYLTQLKMAGRKNISDVQTLVRRGKKVESGQFPFYPWDFVNKGLIPADTEA